MDDISERRIADGLRHGDPQAWALLYEAHARGVWEYVSRLIGANSSDVADVVQETFLAAATSASGYRPWAGTLRAWLFGIARRHVALHYRKEASARRLREAVGRLASSQGGVGWLRGDDPPPELPQSEDVSSVVLASLARLPGEYQKLLIGKYVESATAKAMAAKTGLSEVAVTSKLARARRAFRAALMKLTRQRDRTMENVP